MRRALFIAALALARCAAAAPQETVLNTASLAQPIDQIGVGARALAMGSAYVGVAEGSPALIWNAAGLSSLKSMDLSLHHNSGLADAVQETLLFAMPIGSLGGLGLGLNYVNNGSFEGRDATGNPTSAFTASTTGLQAGWGGELGGGLSLGLALKASQQSLGGESYSSVAGDISALYSLRALRLGLNYANLGSGVAGSSKASGLRLGGSFLIPLEANALLLAASAQVVPGGSSLVQFGAEGRFASAFAVRAGYQLATGEAGYEGLGGVTLGCGAAFSSLSLDYAYLPFGDLGASQRLSLSYTFAPSPQKSAEAEPARPGKAKSASKKTSAGKKKNG